MQITYTLEPKDLKQFASNAHKILPSLRRVRYITLATGPVLAILFASIGGPPPTVWIISFIGFITIYFVFSWLSTKIFQGVVLVGPMRKARGVLGEHTLILTPDALIEKTEVNENHERWQGLIAITESKDHIFIANGAQAVYIIPKRAFNSANQAAEFFNKAKSYHLSVAAA